MSGPWTCFHCEETFSDEREARDHFGGDNESRPACQIKAGAERGLLSALRDAERELREAWHIIHDESAEGLKAYRDSEHRHARQLALAEQMGYERGLAENGGGDE